MPKVFFFGDERSGKTKLIAKLCNPSKIIDMSYEPTIGIDFSSTIRNTVDLKLWDSSGQSRFASLNVIGIGLRGTDVAVYCVDLSKPLNKKIIDADFEKFYQNIADSTIPIILVGTKSDLERQISDDEFEILISNKIYGFTKGIKVSTQDNKNISELVDLVCELAPVTKPSTPLTQHSMFENSQQAKSNSKEEASCEIPLLFYILCVPGWPLFLLYHLVNFLADTCATSSDVGEESVERKLQF